MNRGISIYIECILNMSLDFTEHRPEYYAM